MEGPAMGMRKEMGGSARESSRRLSSATLCRVFARSRRIRLPESINNRRKCAPIARAGSTQRQIPSMRAKPHVILVMVYVRTTPCHPLDRVVRVSRAITTCEYVIARLVKRNFLIAILYDRSHRRFRRITRDFRRVWVEETPRRASASLLRNGAIHHPFVFFAREWVTFD